MKNTFFSILLFSLVTCFKSPIDSGIRYVFPDGNLYQDSIYNKISSFVEIKSVRATLIDGKLQMEIEPRNLWDTVYNDSINDMDVDISVMVDCNKNRAVDAGDIIVSTMLSMSSDSPNSHYFYFSPNWDSLESASICRFQDNRTATYISRCDAKISGEKIILSISNSYAITETTPIRYEISLYTYSENLKQLDDDAYPW